jgi:rhamnose utilization protein RhaD (predicted bifunctional aldolase and dehydrogenase)
MTAEEISPMFKSANVVTAASAGPASPEIVITMNGVFFFLKPPASNKQQGHNLVIPVSVFERFFSGIHPFSVE